MPSDDDDDYDFVDDLLAVDTLRFRELPIVIPVALRFFDPTEEERTDDCLDIFTPTPTVVKLFS